MTVVQHVPTQDIYAWIANASAHPTTPTRNPITQLILPFPRSSMEALVRAVDAQAFADFVVRVQARPGSVTQVPSGVADVVRASSATPGLALSTRMGNVFGITGYYVYTSPPQRMWAGGDTISIPNIVFDLVPPTPDGRLEYSFYGSEQYCKLQYVALP